MAPTGGASATPLQACLMFETTVPTPTTLCMLPSHSLIYISRCAVGLLGGGGCSRRAPGWRVPVSSVVLVGVQAVTAITWPLSSHDVPTQVVSFLIAPTQFVCLVPSRSSRCSGSSLQEVLTMRQAAETR